MLEIPSPLRLRLSSDALKSNWRWMSKLSGAASCGAAIKADAYGLGAKQAMRILSEAGCRHFFVSNWREAAELVPFAGSAELSVLHGISKKDGIAAKMLPARPVLSSVEQIARWKEMGEGRNCDVMVDVGMNRLGISVEEAMAGAADGLFITNLLGHLSSADENEAISRQQMEKFHTVKSRVLAQRYSLANSAGICLGEDFAFDLTRPGIALYGGAVHLSLADEIKQVVTPEAKILQIRAVKRGDAVGYGGIWQAPRDSYIAVINMGYADGYLRCHAGKGMARWGNALVPLVGRVSMDLLAFDVSGVEGIKEGDWLALDYQLAGMAQSSGLSQYELLTLLGQRFDRLWA